MSNFKTLKVIKIFNFSIAIFLKMCELQRKFQKQ